MGMTVMMFMSMLMVMPMSLEVMLVVVLMRLEVMLMVVPMCLEVMLMMVLMSLMPMLMVVPMSLMLMMMFMPAGDILCLLLGMIDENPELRAENAGFFNLLRPDFHTRNARRVQVAEVLFPVREQVIK